MRVTDIREKLAVWYEENRRDLPWRRTRDPYAIWISEIMLQQTRVAAVIPYYERFLEHFPNAQALSQAAEPEVLRYWGGLGYYTRARNLHQAAQVIAENRSFPNTYETIRALKGVGDYTAAAVASIAFGLPHAVVDGNVRRVILRLTGDASADVGNIAARLMDMEDPGRSNQALMELGALICLPRVPLCGKCPLSRPCVANRQGIQESLPPKRERPETVRIHRTMLLIRRRGKILLAPGDRVKGFWDLPGALPDARVGVELGQFRHSILNSQYLCEVREASIRQTPKGFKWWELGRLDEIPLSTTAKKALRCLKG